MLVVGNGLRRDSSVSRFDSSVFSEPGSGVYDSPGVSSALRAASRAVFAAASFFSASAFLSGFARSTSSSARLASSSAFAAAAIRSARTASAIRRGEVFGGRLLMTRAIRGGPRPDRGGLGLRGDEGLLGDGDGEPRLIERPSRRSAGGSALSTSRRRSPRVRPRPAPSSRPRGPCEPRDPPLGGLQVRLEDERPQTRLISLGGKRHRFDLQSRRATGTPGSRAR